MICDASFCTYLLQYWGPRGPTDQRLDVEWVVQQQASRHPAAPPWASTIEACSPPGTGLTST